VIRLRARRAIAILVTLAMGACGGDSAEPSASPGGLPEESGAASPDAHRREGPPTANWKIYDQLRASMKRPRHSSDGGGRALLAPAEGDTRTAISATPGRFRIVYVVGPEGIATGGRIILKVSHFAGSWSAPQIEDPDAPGYTRYESADPEILLRAKVHEKKSVEFRVAGRPLVERDRITIIYGAGPKGARPSRYAGYGFRFWIGVDGDGDGELAMLRDSPAIVVGPQSASGLLAYLPTTARPGDEVTVRLAFIDKWRNARIPVEAEIALESIPDGLELPEPIELVPDDRGLATMTAVAPAPGIYRVRAKSGSFRARSNPIVVSSDEPRVLWGDLHGHSHLSDGVNLPANYYRYARDVTALDVIALTDHDHYGTNDGELYSALDPDTETPQQLWQTLAGQEALTFAHHPAGGPVATNWEIPPDPVLEPLTEIVSVQGSSEAPASPSPLRRAAVEGNFVRDALDRGYRLGFVGSGDSHNGQPGYYQRSPVMGGLAGILSEERTRAGVLEALRARRVYATNGPRILLRTELSGQPMGSVITVDDSAGAAELVVRIVAEAPLDRVDLIRSGAIAESVPAGGQTTFDLRRSLVDLRPGEYLYIRAVQQDEGAAWSSPYWFE
jgi:hypothetical protein